MVCGEAAPGGTAVNPPGHRPGHVRAGRRAAPTAGTATRRNPASPARASRTRPHRRPPHPSTSRGRRVARAHLPDIRRRLIGVLVVIGLVLLLLVGQLVRVQAVNASRYAAYGESLRLHKVTLPAERGAIFDRNGRELALSIRQQTVWANPRLVTDPAGHADALAPILQQDALALQERLSRNAGFVYLARKVDDSTAARVKALDLDGVFFLEEPKRFAPAGDLGASVVGKVGLDNQGLSGLEVQFDSRLAGKPGFSIAEQDPLGNEIAGGLRELESSVPGDDLVLTIDRSLQYETERALAAEIVASNAKGGMAIVMETSTGEILALANLVSGAEGAPPGPSPSNMALVNVYEPGSVNKLITVGAALEEGIIKPTDKLRVASTIRVADKTFSEHDPHSTSDWSITDIVASSSNVGSIMIGQKVGKDRLDAYLRAFGFGSKTGLGFPGESAGILHEPKKYSPTTLGTVSIGQGLAVTAVQMLAAYNTVANGGAYVAPKLVKATVDKSGRRVPTPPSAPRRVVSQRTASQLTGMLNEVVRVGTGTRAQIDGYTVAGKTGTARKPLEGARGYKTGAYVSSFAGFVPSEKPALSAIVMLDEPTPIFGGLVAAPVFAQITRYGLRQLRVPPPPPAAVHGVPKATPSGARPVGEVGGAAATTVPSGGTGDTAPARPTTTLGPSRPAGVTSTTTRTTTPGSP